MKTREKERIYLFYQILSKNLSNEDFLTYNKLKTQKIFNLLKLENFQFNNQILTKIHIGKQFTPQNHNLNYGALLSKLNIKFENNAEILNQIQQFPKQKEYNDIFIYYILITVASLLYDYDENKKTDCLITTFRLLCKFPNSIQFNSLISQSITELYHIIYTSDCQENVFDDVIQSILEYLQAEFEPVFNIIGEIIQSLKYFAKKISKSNDFSSQDQQQTDSNTIDKDAKDNKEDIFVPKICILLSMIIIDKPHFFNEELFIAMFEIIENGLYELNSYALSLFQHFHIYLPQKLQEKFITHIVYGLPSYIEKKQTPFIPFSKIDNFIINLSM